MERVEGQGDEGPFAGQSWRYESARIRNNGLGSPLAQSRIKDNVSFQGWIWRATTRLSETLSSHINERKGTSEEEGWSPS